MKQKIVATIFGGMIALFAMFVFVPSFSEVNAQGSTGAPCTGSNCAQDGLSAIRDPFPTNTTNASSSDVPGLVKKVIEWALYLSAIVAVIFIIIGGFIYMTSAGDATKASKGRATLVNALIGLVMIVLSYLIVQVVYNFIAN